MVPHGQEIFPDQKFKLANISSSEDMLRSDSTLRNMEAQPPGPVKLLKAGHWSFVTALD